MCKLFLIVNYAQLSGRVTTSILLHSKSTFKFMSCKFYFQTPRSSLGLRKFLYLRRSYSLIITFITRLISGSNYSFIKVIILVYWHQYYDVFKRVSFILLLFILISDLPASTFMYEK